MVDITHATDEQILAELKRRQEMLPIRPSPKVHPNFDVLRKAITDFLDELQSNEFDDDADIYHAETIFESAINAFYEPDIWESFIVPMRRHHKKRVAEKEENKEE